MNTRFVSLSLGSHVISHGYDKENKEIMETVSVEGYTKKLVAVDRIKSVSERYILIDYLDGRWVYWEYEEDFMTLKALLEKVG